MLIAKGTILLLETGEYSDHSVIGPFVVVKDFDQAKVAERYRHGWKTKLTPTPLMESQYVYEDDWREAPYPEGFIAWLATESYIEDAPAAFRWHVGSCSSFEPGV